MAVHALRTKELSTKDQFWFEKNDKLRLSLVGMAEKFSENARTMIFMTYNDPEINAIYRNIRNSGIYDKGSKGLVRRKILEFPNSFVYDYCDTVLSALYGKDWSRNNKALRHELVRPWWVVSKL